MLRTPRGDDDSDSRTRRITKLQHLPAKERVAALAIEMKNLPQEFTDENVFFTKAIHRLWDSARIEAGIVTAEEVQQENSPVTFKEMAKATLAFGPRG